MPSARESRAALLLLTDAAVSTGQELFRSTSGSPEQRRLQMLNGIPEVISYYADGSSALAADYYEEAREAANPSTRFVPQLVVADRTEKIRNAVAWAAAPLFGDGDGSDDDVPGRLAEILQLESARPYRDTITGNRRRDPAAVGWTRIAAGGCKFCSMLAARGAVYSERSVEFAAHPNCHCSAAPVFEGGERGPEASVIQYVASKRNRTPAQRASLRDYLNTYYPDAHG